MNRLLIALVAALVCVPALADGIPAPGHKAHATRTRRGKPTAPVEVTAALGAETGKVTVRFLSDARDVSVEVRGIDGLHVTSEATPISNAQFARGDSRIFELTFAPGPGRSNLVVAVNGTFGGAKRTSVVTFAVGTPTPDQLKRTGTVTTNSKGERIKTLRAETK